MRGSVVAEDRLVSDFFGISQEEPNLTMAAGEPAQDPAGDPAPVYVNEHFRDVAETGSWGKVSSKEIVLVLVVALLIAGGVVLGSVYLLSQNDSENIIPPPFEPVPFDEMYHSSETLYSGLIANINKTMANAATILATFPSSHTDLFGVSDLNHYLKAADWLVNIDAFPVNFASTILPRFALAVTYYSLNGQNWFNNTNWMGPAHECSWFGVECTNFHIQGISLGRNNVTGSLHEVWESLDACQALLFRDNAISGNIPGESLGSMSRLRILQLQNNALSGTVPSSLRNAATLDTLFVNGNPLLNGSWPQVFCPDRADRDILGEFGLNCDLIECSCCDSERNCFQ